VSQPRSSECNTHKYKNFFSGEISQLGPGRFIIEVSRSHIDTHTHTLTR